MKNSRSSSTLIISGFFADCSKRAGLFLVALLLFAPGLLRTIDAAERTLGDIDGDGVVTVLDIVNLNKHASRQGTLEEGKKIYADLNQDGVINDADREMIIKGILETETPENLPLAKVREVSPTSGESNVAVTRETILYLTMPLSANATINTTNLYAKFGDRKLLTRAELSSDKRKVTLFYLEPIPASATITVYLDSTGLSDLVNRPIDADGDGVAGGVYTTSFTTLGITALPNTGVVGQVLASEKDSNGNDIPIAGAIVTVDGMEETLRAVTDANGNFTLSPAPAGSFFVHIDGREAPIAGQDMTKPFTERDYYPFVGKKWFAEAGNSQNKSGDIDDTPNQGGGTGVIYLPLVKAGSLKTVSATQTTEITAPPLDDPALNQMMQGVKLEVPAGSLFSDDGLKGGSVGIAPVAPDRLPSPLPEGLVLPLVITVQTDGPTNFDRPVPVTFPNLPDPVTGEKLGPGEKSALWSFNHDTGKWEIVGPMTVTEDGNFVETDAGVGLLQPGWHGARRGAWGEGKVCHACSKQAGEAWREASEMAYEISIDLLQFNKDFSLEAGNVLKDRFFNSIQFAEAAGVSSGAPAGLTVPQLDGLKSYLGDNSDRWLPRFSQATASFGSTALLNASIDALDNQIKKGSTTFQFSWHSTVKGLVEWNPDGTKPVILDLPIRMSLLSFAVLAKPVKEIFDPSKEWQDLRNKQQNLIGLIQGCLKSEQDKQVAADLANSSEASQKKLTDQIEKELAAWAGLLETTPDLEVRNPASQVKTPGIPTVDLPSKGLTKANAEKWLAYLQKVRSLLLLLQVKNGGLNQDFNELIHLLDDYFAKLNPYAVDCQQRMGFGREEVRPLRELFVLLQNPAPLNERFKTSTAYIERVLTPQTPYLMKVYSAKSKMIGAVYFYSPVTGAWREIPTVPMVEDRGSDADKDGMSDEAEAIVGTDPAKADTDGDGVNDYAELLNGTDPGSNRPLRTGLIGTIPVSNWVQAKDVDVDNGTLAVALGSSGIGIYDVSVPTAPQRLREYSVGGDVVSVAVGRDYAVGAAGWGGLAIVPLSATSGTQSPVNLQLGSPVKAVTTDGMIAYAGLQNGNIVAVEMATGLEISRTVTDVGDMEDIDYGGGYVFARGYYDLQVFEIGVDGLQNVTDAIRVNSLRTAGGRRFRANYGGDYVISADNIGYDVLDITNNFSKKFAERLGRTSDSDWGFDWSTVQYGWKQMVPTGSGLGIAVVSPNSTDDGPHHIDIYDFKAGGVTKPEWVTTYETPGLAVAACLYNGFAYIADSYAGVQILNYAEFDTKKQAPTILLDSNINLDSGELEEGQLIQLRAKVADDVQVRNVEFYLNDERISDGNFPFELTYVTPTRDVTTTLTIKAIAYDTGGNSAETKEYVFQIGSDKIPPEVVKHSPEVDEFLDPIETAWVRFSEPLNEDTLGEAVQVVGAGPDKQFATDDDLTIPVVGTFNAETFTYALKFEAPLDAGKYRLVVSQAVTDLAGNSLAAKYVSGFSIFSDGDTDEDGIPDDWELKLGLNPEDPYSRWKKEGGDQKKDGQYDSDNDGLTDAGEFIMKTDIAVIDSDGDGISDGFEDADLDGLRDGLEISYGTDPFKVDTDGDMLDDNSEIADGTDPKRKNNMPITLVSQPASYLYDLASPWITLLGENPLNLIKGATFQDPGAVVEDDVDLKKTITGNGTVDTAVVGNYTLTYSATDRSGKSATSVIRSISVIDPAGDEDGDGLTNSEEFAIGSDPRNSDTDGDGYSDKEEVDAGSDPLDENDFPSTNYDEMVVVAGGELPGGSAFEGNYVGAFQIGKYEVTWAEWKEVRDWAVENGYTDLAGVGQGSGDDHPVQEVNWYDAIKWSNAKSEKEGLVPFYQLDGVTYRAGEGLPTLNITANGYRLPTKAEWEWAARGGVNSQGYTYSGSNDVNEVAWYLSNSDGGTKAVGTKNTNELAIHDMSGNVWEWCLNNYNNSDRVISGGNWNLEANWSSLKDGWTVLTPNLRYSGIGLRLARNVVSDMVYVDGGTLPADSELSEEEMSDFKIARTEVTWGEWKAVRDWALANGYDDLWIGDGSEDSHPVRNVSWYDVVKWCNAKSEMQGLIPVYRVDGDVYRTGFTGSSDSGFSGSGDDSGFTGSSDSGFTGSSDSGFTGSADSGFTGSSDDSDEDFIFDGADGYRLPSEIEWEWAARGGVFSANYTFSGSNTLDEVAWHIGNSQGALVDLVGNNTTLGTWPVALKLPNELGLFDMSGNVMEWCLDSYDSYHKRVRGGGFWSNGYHGVRDRYFDGVDDRNVNIGFRVAQSVYYPENDNFSDAYVLEGIDEIDWAYSTGATAEDYEPNHYGQSAVASLWWSWTAPVDGLVRVTTFGSNFDTILGVYTGEELETLDSVVANDDSGESLRSALVFEAEAGTTYHIAVDGYEGEQGSVELSLEVLSLNPQGDEDGDGLSNEQERALGTDPYEADSDGDGYSDREEVEADTDPLDVDDKPGIEYSEGTAFGGSYAWAQGVEVAVQMPMLDDGGHWIIVSGNLPKGLILGVDSRITGVPTEAGVTDVVMGYEANTGTSETRLRIRIIPTTASGGGYTFAHLAGALWGQFSGSADASGAYTGSGDGFSGSNDSFNGSGDGGFVGSGDGMGGWIGNKDGVGTQAMFHRPGGVAVAPDGTIYVSDTGNNAIRKIDANGQVTKLAGNFLGSADGNFLGSSDGVFSGSADGTGEDAGFKNPQGIIVDKDGNILVADRKNHAIRKVTPQGVVTTVAGSFTGSGTGGFSGSSDGLASGARFNHPSDVVVDASGNIYVADSGNHAIRKIDTNGNVTTLAGDLGFSGYADATRDSAMFNSPQGIAIDSSGNIIVADTTNGLIRKVSPDGVVTTIAGALFTNNAGAAFQGSGGEAFTGSAGEGGRSGWSDKAYAYFTGSMDGFTGSGDGFTGSGDGFTGSADGGFTGSADLGWPESIDGSGDQARFSFPTDVEVDSVGNIFVVDSGSSSIRKISPDGVVTTIGNVPEGFFYFPQGIAIGANGRLVVSDSGNNRIAESTAPSSATTPTPEPTPTPGPSPNPFNQ
jgi:formylglycine-generating enzyme required for sulfatase activity